MSAASLLRPRSWTQRGVVCAAILVLHLGVVAIGTISRVREAQQPGLATIGITLLLESPEPEAPSLPQAALVQPMTVNPVLPELAIEVEQAPTPTAITLSAAPTAGPALTGAAAEPASGASPEIVHDIEYRHAPPAAYPAIAMRQRLEGTVFVQVVVDEEGRPASVVVQKSCGHRPLDEAALAAVRGWLFRPYERNGVAMRVAAIVPVKFSLRVRTAQTR